MGAPVSFRRKRRRPGLHPRQRSAALGLAGDDHAWSGGRRAAVVWAVSRSKVADMRPEEYFIPDAPEPVIRGGAGRVVAIKQSGAINEHNDHDPWRVWNRKVSQHAQP